VSPPQRPVLDATGMIPGVRHLVDSVTRIVAGVMAASIVLFTAYIVVDLIQGTDTILIRGPGALVLVACLMVWLWARHRYQPVLAGIAGLVFSTTVSICTTLVTQRTDTSFQIAMAYGLVIAVLNVLVWRSAPAILIGCVGAIGPPFLLMLSQHPSRDTLIDFTGVTVITIVLAIVILRVQQALVRELTDLQAQLVAEASLDGLTGLPNRKNWLARLAAWQGVNPGAAYEVLFFDLDRFKEVNDRLGHDAGDRVLVAFAQMLADLVPRDGMAARFGGDEFVAFVPGADGATDRFLVALATAIAGSDLRSLGVEVSVGRAAGLPGRGGEDVLWLADQALLESKRRAVHLPVPA
jgi:diguanylate cyclase (GGDEF)-like protein